MSLSIQKRKSKDRRKRKGIHSNNFTLVYSTLRDDRTGTKTLHLVKHPLDLLVEGKDLYDARKRISCNVRMKVKYFPSKDYQRYRAYLIIHKVLPLGNIPPDSVS